MIVAIPVYAEEEPGQKSYLQQTMEHLETWDMHARVKLEEAVAKVAKELNKRSATLAKEKQTLLERKEETLRQDTPMKERKEYIEQLLDVMTEIDKTKKDLEEVKRVIDTYLGTPVLRLVSIQPLEAPGASINKLDTHSGYILSTKVTEFPLEIRPGTRFVFGLERKVRNRWLKEGWCEDEYDPEKHREWLAGAVTNKDFGDRVPSWDFLTYESMADSIYGAVRGSKVFARLCQYAPFEADPEYPETRRQAGFELEERLDLKFVITPNRFPDEGVFRFGGTIQSSNETVARKIKSDSYLFENAWSNSKGFCTAPDPNECAQLSLVAGTYRDSVVLNYRQVKEGEPYITEPPSYEHPTAFGTPPFVGEVIRALALPDFTGQTPDKATAWLLEKDLQVSMRPGSPPPRAQLSGVVEMQDPPPGTEMRSGSTVVLTVHSGYKEIGKVPDLIGAPLSQAELMLQQQGLGFALRPGSIAPTAEKSGTVESQDPEPGVEIEAGGMVTLTIYGDFIDVREVPFVVGLSADEAKARIEAAGLKVALQSGSTPSSREQGSTVQRQSPEPGTTAEAGLEVTVVVYGPYVEIVTVPDVRRLSYDEAKQELEAAGLSLDQKDAGESTDRSLANRAKKQEPPAGTRLNWGETVRVWFYAPYVPTREEQVADTDCSKYPGTRARWDEETGKPVCDCIDGFPWNLARTACVTQDALDQEICGRDYPGSVPGGRDASGKINCVCPQGFVWNSERTGCIEQPAVAGGTGGQDRDWRGWDRNQQCEHLISQVKNFMWLYQQDPRNNSHLKGVAEGSAQQARNLGCDENQISQALGTPTGGGGGGESGYTGGGGGCYWEMAYGSSTFGQDEDPGEGYWACYCNGRPASKSRCAGIPKPSQ
jgi:beta-lactam-binding protein with PASTA domain